jgi:hypothetical protein
LHEVAAREFAALDRRAFFGFERFTFFAFFALFASLTVSCCGAGAVLTKLAQYAFCPMRTTRRRPIVTSGITTADASPITDPIAAEMATTWADWLSAYAEKA